MTIAVTAEDIQRGDRHSCNSCPVALAVKRVTGYPVSVQPWYIELRRAVVWELFGVPQVVTDFIDMFDAGKPVESFSFELEVRP